MKLIEKILREGGFNQLFEKGIMTLVEKILNEAIDIFSLLKRESFRPLEEFISVVQGLEVEQKKELMKWVEEINNNWPYKGNVILYHGSPFWKEIMDKGFKLTQGRRAGIMGSEKLVQNQGIFLTDSPSIAHFFGQNREEYNLKQRYQVLTVYADIHKVLEVSHASKLPTDLKKIALKHYEEWEGRKNGKLFNEDVWELLDLPHFVDEIKAKGYDAVKFKEDPGTNNLIKKTYAKKALGHTYCVFDPSKLEVKMKHIVTFADLQKYLQHI